VIALEEKLSDDEIKPKNLALVGRSAGAYLAMRYGYTHYKESLTPSPITISHIVADVGPTDAMDQNIINMWSGSNGFGASGVYLVLSILAGVEVTALDDRTAIPELIAASPLTRVTPNVPPTLLRYAKNDNLVPFAHGEDLAEALDNAGVDFDLFLFKESTHRLDFDGIPSGISDEELERYQDYWAKYDWYFDEYMIGEPED